VAAEPLAAFASSAKFIFCAFADDFTFKLSKGKKDVEG
jgi:hypothetical protein